MIGGKEVTCGMDYHSTAWQCSFPSSKNLPEGKQEIKSKHWLDDEIVRTGFSAENSQSCTSMLTLCYPVQYKPKEIHVICVVHLTE